MTRQSENDSSKHGKFQGQEKTLPLSPVQMGCRLVEFLELKPTMCTATVTMLERQWVPSSVTPGNYTSCCMIDSGGFNLCTQCLMNIMTTKLYLCIHMDHHDTSDGHNVDIRWPQREDICCIPWVHVLGKVSAQSTTSGWSHKISAEDSAAYRNIFQKSNQQNGTLAVLPLHISLLICYIRCS